MKGKTCLVTGATSGIGKETALGLARKGAAVVLAARDRARGEAARAEIVKRSGNAGVSFLVADFASLAEVRRLAAEVRSTHPALHVLVNNAGVMLRKRSVTRDGFETTFAVNHLAPFLLTNLLLDLLKAGAPARIVNVASEAHRSGALGFDDLQSERGFDGYRVYGTSKLANVLFTSELARRLDGTGVTVNALHPGVVATGIVRDFPALVRGGWGLFTMSAGKGARTSLYLATSPEVEGMTGKYFDECAEVRPSRAACDEAAARKLWEVSERLTGLGGAEPKLES